MIEQLTLSKIYIKKKTLVCSVWVLVVSVVCLLSHFVFQKLCQGEQTRYFTSPGPFTQSELLWYRLPVVCRQQLLQKTSPPELLGRL